MTNEQLKQFDDGDIVDAFVDNYYHLLCMDESRDLLLFQWCTEIKNILVIELQIRDIAFYPLIARATEMHNSNAHLQKIISKMTKTNDVN